MTSLETTDRARDWSHPSSRVLEHLTARRIPLYLVAAFFLAVGTFVLYTQTLVPSFLDGDQGEFQFMPAVLGIPHPSGFPLYMLLAHVWSGLPISTLAYRMNLFSALCGALTVAALFAALYRQKLHPLAALSGALTLAVIPEFWQFSTVAAVYRLHTLIVVLFFLFLAEWERTGRLMWLYSAALTFGLDLANHLTIIFFIPATALFIFLVGRRTLFRQREFWWKSMVLVLLPLVLYLYFPVRGQQLLTNDLILPNWPLAAAQGIVSPFYKNTPNGLLEYFTGTIFARHILGNWKFTLSSLIPDWLNLILSEVNGITLAFALLGLVLLFRTRRNLALWAIVVILAFQFTALQYSYLGLAAIGEFSSYFREYFLPSFIVLIILAAWGMDALVRGVQGALARIQLQRNALAAALPMILPGVVLLVSAKELTARYPTVLNARSAEIELKWRTIQRFPLEQGAALAGHWGDLTPLWYLQYAEGWRRDLITIHPPDKNWMKQYVATGKPLYLAGPLLDWEPSVTNYRLTPWGPLVRVTANPIAPPSPLSHPVDVRFGDDPPVLRLSGYDSSLDQTRTVRVGDSLDFAAYWQVLDKISLDDYVMYLSLANAEDRAPAQPYPIAVGWLPGKKLDPEQRALGVYRYTVPWGTRPGSYDLELVLYSVRDGKNLNAGDSSTLKLGTVRIDSALSYPETVKTDHPTDAGFGVRVRLLGWSGEVQQLATGNTASIELLWKALDASSTDLNARVSLENTSASYLLADAPLVKNYAASNWHPGEIVRATQSLTVPADVPDGDYDLVLRVHEASSDKPLASRANVRDNGISLGRVRVVGRPHSYEIPPIANPQQATFADRVLLLGYAMQPNKLRAGELLKLTVYWQAQKTMGESYKVFVHVVDAQDKIQAQQDSIPGAGTLPTTGWLPREVITDSFDLMLPPDIPPGTYQIKVGLYNEANGQRVPVVDANGQPAQDHIVLDSEIQVLK